MEGSLKEPDLSKVFVESTEKIKLKLSDIYGKLNSSQLLHIHLLVRFA